MKFLFRFCKNIIKFLTPGPACVPCKTCHGLGEWWEGEWQHPCPYCGTRGYVVPGSQSGPYDKGDPA